jgi:hypothetical protein
MKNILNSIIFYCTSLIAAVSGVILIVHTLNALMTGVALKDPNHFKTIGPIHLPTSIGWIHRPTFGREMLLSEKAFASALFNQDLDQDPQAIKRKASIEYKNERPKILQAEAKREWRDSAKWFVCFFTMLFSYALSRFFGRMISRSYPEFIDKKVITSIIATFLILYAGGRFGWWAYETVDTYFKEESVLTEKDIENYIGVLRSKIENGDFKGALSYFYSQQVFSQGEILALTDQNFSFSTLHKLITPLIESSESRKEGDSKETSLVPLVSAIESRKEGDSKETSLVRLVDALKKHQKFYAQQDFYTPSQIGFLINQHNESARGRNHLLHGVLAGLLGVGLLFFRRSRHEAEATS